MTPFLRSMWSGQLGVLITLLAGVTTTGALRAQPNATTDDAALRSYLSGNGLLNRGLYELAATEYRKFLAERADHEKATLARYGLGVSLYRTGQHEAALGELSPLAAISDFAFAAEVGTISGQCLLALGRQDDAAAAFQKTVTRFPQHQLADDAAAGAVEAFNQAAKPDEVIRASQEFLTRWGDSPLRERVEYLWGLAALAKSDHPVAIEHFSTLLDRYPKSPLADHATLILAQAQQLAGTTDKAIAGYRRVIARADTKYAPEALLALGTLLHTQKQLPGAGEALDRLLEKFPQSESAKQAKFERALVFFDEEKFDRAAELLTPLAAGGDAADEAAYWLAKCNSRQGRFAEAAKTLAEASAKFPQSRLIAELLYDRAVALVRSGDAAEAVQVLAEFRTRFGEHALAADATHLLAVTQHQQKQFDASAALCKEFLAKNPEHTLAPSIRFLTGENEFLAGRYADAVTRFREFLSRYTSDPRAVTAGFRMAIALYRLERYDEAEPLLSKLAPFAAKDETYRPALLALGDVHMRRSDWKNAEQDFAEYLKGGMEIAGADDALMKLAHCKQRQDRSAEALADYSSLVERFPQTPHRIQAIFEQGQLLLAADKLDEASAAFEKVVATGADTPFAVHAQQHLANIAMRQQKFDRAAELYAQSSSAKENTAADADSFFGQAQALVAARKFAEAEKAFTAFLARQPDHVKGPEARARLAIAVARQDRPADAMKAIETAEGGLALLDPELRTAVRYEKAWALRALNRNDDAITVYRTLADDGVGTIRVHAMLELAELEAAAKNFEPAAAVLRKLRDELSTAEAKSAAADLAEQATYRLAVCEFELNHHDVTASTLDEFLKQFPQSTLTASACFYRGEALFRLGRHEPAAAMLTRVTKEFASDPTAAPAMLRLGECLALLQRWSLSEEAYKDYLLRSGESEFWYQARFGIGWACENQKRHADAITSYRDVVDRHQGPTAARAQFQIGECLFAQAKYEEAAAELLKVDILYAFPEWSAAALYEAGRCFEKLGKPGDARTQFSTVAEKYKDTNWANLAAQRLSELSSAEKPG